MNPLYLKRAIISRPELVDQLHVVANSNRVYLAQDQTIEKFF
jgi:hypothetical protein